MSGRVLVFGASGQLARELQRAPWREGIELTALDRRSADLSAPEKLGTIVREHRPNAVIVAAAYTAVDKAESEEAAATIVNGDAPGAIAAAAAAIGAPVIHVSTDYVFDGTKAEPYDEDDAVGPIGAYGRSKLAGEVAVRAANPRHLILRTSWVYSAHGQNFLRTMLRLAATRAEVNVVADQFGCPTAAGDLASAIAATVPRMLSGDAAWGTYHVAGGSATSWHGFAEAIFEALAARGLRRPINVPIETSAYPTPARRPANSRLSSDRFARVFGMRLPGFEAAIPEIIGETLAATATQQNEGAVA